MSGVLWDAVRSPVAILYCNMCGKQPDQLFALRFRIAGSVTAKNPNGSFGLLAICAHCAIDSGKRVLGRPIHTSVPTRNRRKPVTP
jgi:hypothetical protein